MPPNRSARSVSHSGRANRRVGAGSAAGAAGSGCRAIGRMTVCDPAEPSSGAGPTTAASSPVARWSPGSRRVVRDGPRGRRSPAARPRRTSPGRWTRPVRVPRRGTVRADAGSPPRRPPTDGRSGPSRAGRTPRTTGRRARRAAAGSSDVPVRHGEVRTRAGERRATGQQLVEHDPGAVDVGGRTRASVADRLGCHVLRRAEEPGGRAFAFGDDRRDPEVGHPDGTGRTGDPRGLEQDVVGLHVTVGDVPLVRRGECVEASRR